MNPLFTGWKQVERKLHPLKDMLWLFDYDGTLTPIVSHPDRAVLKPDIRALLKRWVQRFPGRVGVLSGRSLADIRQRVRIPGLIYGGAHGFEFQGPGLHFRRMVPPEQVKVLKTLEQDLRQGFRGLPGAWVENKNWMLAAHYRQVRPADRARVQAVLNAVRATARRKGFEVQDGLKVMEVFSDPGWDKGKAASWLKRKLRARRIFYIGDDTTDERVFRALGPQDVSVRVGSQGPSHARYRVPHQRKVTQLLRRVIP